MGGMAAFVPSRKDPDINATALAKVTEDKKRESQAGFDGTWVAHPDLVPVALEPFGQALGGQPNQVARQRGDVEVAAEDLLDFRVPDGAVTEDGLRNNSNVAIQYLSSWLTGNGAAAIFNLMEDAATAEIARSQIWQWVHNGAELADGRVIDDALVRRIEAEELDSIRAAVGEETFAKSRATEAQALFEQVALGRDFVEFLTLPAYDHLD